MAKKRKKLKKLKIRRSRRTFLEGDVEQITIRRAMASVAASLPRKVLRYLKASEGDKLNITAHNGVIEIAPIFSIEEEIDNYVSH